MAEIEAIVLPVVSKSSTHKTIISNDHQNTVYTHLDLIYTFGIFAREGRHPSWNATLLGLVLTRIVTYLACKPKMD